MEITDIEREKLVKGTAIRLFGTFTYSRLLQDPFMSGTPCMYQGCGGKVSGRALFKLGATVFEANLCEEHIAAYHGRVLSGPETFPWSNGK